jgi:hypothetical protein
MEMAVREITPQDLVRHVRQAAGLPTKLDNQLDEPLLGALARRAASILCPCSRATVTASVMESLDQLTAEPDRMRDDVEAAIEGLIVVGDLLELNQVTIDDPNVKGTWIFTAPPGFVSRRNGTIFILGVARDESSPLSTDLSERIIHNRYGRTIPSLRVEELPGKLMGLGLLQHSEETWLKAPKEQPAATLVEKVEARLIAQPASGDIADLLILNPERDVRYYRGRWMPPKSQTGIFVARRPQQYGAPLWGVVQLASGTPTKFLDLPTKAARWRGCDEAWHVQMAIDRQRGTPQRYRRRGTPDGAYLDFFSPLPLWAERHLAVIGEPSPPAKCLFSYHVSQTELSAEEDFLQKRLWLARDDDTKLLEC